MKNKYFLAMYIGGIFVLPQFLIGQNPYIFSHDKYGGISTAPLSPTQPFLNPNGWDFHIFSEDIFIQNQYIYIAETSIIGLLKGDIKTADYQNGTTQDSGPRIADYYNQTTIKEYHFSSDFMGPSVSFNFPLWEKDISLGFFTRLRTQSSSEEIDDYLQFTNQNIIEPVIYTMAPFKTNFMNWSEVGLNFSTEVFPYSDWRWIVGFNLKYEMGLDAFYVDNKKDVLLRRELTENPEDPNLPREKNLYADNFDVEVGYVTNYDIENEQYSFNQNGKGIGLDVGLTILKYDYKEDIHDLKLSFNLLDLGYVNFDGFVHQFAAEEIWYKNNDYYDNYEFETLEGYAQHISQDIYGDPNQSLVSNEFSIGLPTSIHINGSKNIGENKFVNFNLVQRVPVFENSLKRNNILNLSYLFEKPNISYGFSVSTYEYQNLQLGAFLRYGPLLIGSENILPFLLPHGKLHGMDFYFGLKLYPFWEDDLDRRSREKCKC